ncbi:MAG: hypothetical protein ABIW31_08655 [Novosphingobium sp.]
MYLISTILAPLLLLPVTLASPAAPDRAVQETRSALTRQPSVPPVESSPADSFPFSWLAEAWRTPSAEQVSIEQHITIRIAPRAPSNADPRIGMFTDMPERSAAQRLTERAMGKCLAIDGVAGVQIAASNKLVLFLRDARVVTAGLDKGCNAQDFYAGFYVARSADGMMCAGRDKLQSRNGASCKLGKLHQLVAAGD